jgi:hypothetical protein
MMTTLQYAHSDAAVYWSLHRITQQTLFMYNANRVYADKKTYLTIYKVIKNYTITSVCKRYSTRLLWYHCLWAWKSLSKFQHQMWKKNNYMKFYNFNTRNNLQIRKRNYVVSSQHFHFSIPVDMQTPLCH